MDWQWIGTELLSLPSHTHVTQRVYEPPSCELSNAPLLILLYSNIFTVIHTLITTRYCNHQTVPHYDDFIMSVMVSQITSLTVIYSTVYSGTDQRRHRGSASMVNTYIILYYIILYHIISYCIISYIISCYIIFINRLCYSAAAATQTLHLYIIPIVDVTQEKRDFFIFNKFDTNRLLLF